MKWLRIAVAVFLLVGSVLLFMVAMATCRARPNWLGCRNNLRQLGLAARQYADEKRFFPHIAKVDELDGGVESPTAAKALRTLVYLTYLDEPRYFACPSSPDDEIPGLLGAAREDARCFGWEVVAPLQKDATPLYQVEPTDRPLTQMKTLSYGWTRKAVTPNSPGNALLAGDKACKRSKEPGARVEDADHRGNMVGNHPDNMQAVTADGRVVRFEAGKVEDGPVPKEWNVAGDGFLGVLPDADLRTESAVPEKEPFQLRGEHYAGIAFALAIGIILFPWLARPRTGPLGEPL